MAVTVTAPPSTTKLIALADLKAVLGITDSANDALLGNIIQRGSDATGPVLQPHVRPAYRSGNFAGSRRATA
jgi:hypothetical protein